MEAPGQEVPAATEEVQEAGADGAERATPRTRRNPTTSCRRARGSSVSHWPRGPEGAGVTWCRDAEAYTYCLIYDDGVFLWPAVPYAPRDGAALFATPVGLDNAGDLGSGAVTEVSVRVRARGRRTAGTSVDIKLLDVAESLFDRVLTSAGVPIIDELQVFQLGAPEAWPRRDDVCAAVAAWVRESADAGFYTPVE